VFRDEPLIRDVGGMRNRVECTISDIGTDQNLRSIVSHSSLRPGHKVLGF
jgi:hypothetical protein